MTTDADPFDLGAEEVWRARGRGEKILKPDLARIMRTAFQTYQVTHPHHTPTLPDTKRTRARNPLFDALSEATGSNPGNLTRSGGKAIGVALAEIQEAYPEVTPEDIHKAALEYKRKHRDWPLTSNALSKHWAECFGGGSERTLSAKKDPYQAPPNWKEAAAKAYPGTEIPEMVWEKIPHSIKLDIIRLTS